MADFLIGEMFGPTYGGIKNFLPPDDTADETWKIRELEFHFSAESSPPETNDYNYMLSARVEFVSSKGALQDDALVGVDSGPHYEFDITNGRLKAIEGNFVQISIPKVSRVRLVDDTDQIGEMPMALHGVREKFGLYAPDGFHIIGLRVYYTENAPSGDAISGIGAWIRAIPP